MRNGLVCVALAAVTLCFADAARAVDVLAYSYETVLPAGPDGFFGLGATVTQDTIGATHLQHSMKYDVGAGGFVGARTETVIPPELNDPPGVDYVLFDMNVPAAYGGTFADIGVTVFGHALNAVGGAQFGHQVQFADTEPIAGKAPGQYTDLRIDLNQSVGPYRPGESFNQIFGPNPNDLTVASAFQFFISKNSANPVTVYIDNVRLGTTIPEPMTLGLLGLGAVVLGIRDRRRR
jgi:hypothetical protein